MPTADLSSSTVAARDADVGLSIIVPAHNEAAGLAGLHQRIGAMAGPPEAPL